LIAAEAQYRDWMLAGLAGDGHAYRQLLAALTGHMRAYFSRRVGPSAAEDLVQETLIAMHTKRATYDPGQPFTAWIHGIARYKLIDEYRRQKRRASVPLDEAPDLFAHDETQDAVARRDVTKLLAHLPEAKRKLVQATKLDGLSTAEAASATGLSESAVKVTVHRAIKSLSDELDAGKESGREDR
jgi:RNA polymerase sigma-70 factor (ECF subfamily)